MNSPNDLLCFSHLRWDFVFQRPQHLMSRFASKYRVFFIEEPVYDDSTGYYDIRRDEKNDVWIVVPHLNKQLSADNIVISLRQMIDHLMHTSKITHYITWYYTPLALKFTGHLRPEAVVYDCMDELSAFKFAPPDLKEYEALIMRSADVVFTGGYSLFEAKKNRHHNIFAFPSSIDKNHFNQARDYQSEPRDQRQIGDPKLGFFGVIDERFDVSLVREVALRRPDLHFILIGPIVKIDIKELPVGANIHYLGAKDYDTLPRYLSWWDIAIMPFARNESTRFISPTKTPEYLCGGQPVISTSIPDVVSPYGKMGLVEIADTPEEFIEAVDKLLAMSHDEYLSWLENVDNFLSENSWDKTYEAMNDQIQKCLDKASYHENLEHNV
jgi:UDP-galactopyranose mutase